MGGCFPWVDHCGPGQCAGSESALQLTQTGQNVAMSQALASCFHRTNPGMVDNHARGSTYTVKVIAASGLSRISGFRRPKPFATITAGNNTFRTRTANNTTSPTWAEDFQLTALSESAIVEFQVLHDSSGRSRPLGSFAGSISHLVTLQQAKDEVVAHLDNSNVSARNHQQPPSTCQTITFRIMQEAPLPLVLPGRSDRNAAQQTVATMRPPGQGGQILRSTDNPHQTARVGDQLRKLVRLLDMVVKVADRLATIHPYAYAAWQILSVTYNVIQAQRRRDDRIFYLVSSMVDVYSFVEHANLLQRIEPLRDTVSSMVRQTMECADFIREYMQRGFYGRAIRDTVADTDEKIMAFEKSFRALRQNFDTGMNINTAIVSMHVQADLHGYNKRLLMEHLPFVPASWNAECTCLAGTRVDIVEHILDWTNSTETDRNIFWLCGVAGCGKSAISHSVSQIFSGLRQLGSCFFFNRDSADRNGPHAVFTTLAHDLSSFDTRIGEAVALAIEKNRGVGHGSVRRQFQELIVKPLSNLDIIGPVIIVFDALDECGTAFSRKEFLDVLANETANLPSWVRIIITSRLEPDITLVFDETLLCEKEVVSLESECTVRDIDLYIRFRMSTIVSTKPHLRLQESWPGDDIRADLVHRAAGLFIWASTACAFIEKSYDPTNQLRRLLSGDVHRNATSAIDALYTTALLNVYGWDDTEFVHAFQTVMGTIVVAENRLSSTAMDTLLGEELHGIPSQHAISSLACILTIDPTVRVLHPSFEDFITDPSKCTDVRMCIDRPVHRKRVFRRCLQRMYAGLQRNICNLDDPSLLNKEIPELERVIQDAIPEELQYSCRFWAAHACELEADQDVDSEVRGFLSKHFLHWLEVMSLLGEFDDVEGQLEKLHNCMMSHSPRDVELCELTYDAYRFTQSFSWVISQSALHVYISALPFTPQDTKIYRMFSKVTNNVPVVVAGADYHWSATLHTLEGHASGVLCMGLSPDASRIVSGGEDASVRIWDTHTGALIFPLEGHRGVVRCTTFSPDGNFVASGSDDSVVNIWNATTGLKICTPCMHDSAVTCIVFCRDGRLFSGTKKGSINIWDVSSGRLISPAPSGHADSITSLSISSDGCFLASSSLDHTIRVWDPSTGAKINTFTGHCAAVRTVVFSPDASKLVSGSDDGTVRVWDRESTESVTLQQHDVSRVARSVFCAIFSPDGSKIASSSMDNTICICDAHTGDLLTRLYGHGDWVRSIAFSSDGSRIVSASDDHTIRLWSSSTGILLQPPFEGHTDWVRVVALSTNGSTGRIISASEDGTIRIWDAISSASFVSDSQSHKSAVTHLVFAPCGGRIASCSWDNTICISDADRGVIQTHIDAHSQGVRTVAFSSDGLLIASGSGEHTVCIWNATTGALQFPPLVGHTDPIKSLLFSHCGSKLVSGGEDNKILIWDTHRGTLLLPELKGHTMSVSALAFSPDESLLASASRDSSVRVWDTNSGNLLLTLLGHEGWIHSVTFSPNGRQVLSGSEESDALICVWDVSTGELCADPFQGHTVHLSTIFNSDGSCMLPANSLHEGNIQSNAGPGEVVSTTWNKPDCILDLAANGWVVDLLSGKRVWWMPASHRNKYKTSHLMRMSIGHWSGRVTVVKGDPLLPMLRLNS